MSTRSATSSRDVTTHAGEPADDAARPLVIAVHTVARMVVIPSFDITCTMLMAAASARCLERPSLVLVVNRLRV